MKVLKVAAIAWSILSSVPMSAQEVAYKEKLDSIVHTITINEKATTRKEVFYYDNEGRICQIAEYHRKGSWEPYSLTQCKYDTEGRNNVWERNLLKGNTWYTFERMEVEYDSTGNLQKMNSDELRYTFIYNADSLPEEITIQALRDGQWEDISRRKYTYSGKHMTGSASEDYRDGAWKEYRKKTYEYDANGNMIAEVFKAHLDSATYSYDANGRMTRRLRYGIDEFGEWRKEPSSERRYTYDVQGNCTEMTDIILPDRLYKKEVREYDATTPASQVAGLSNVPLLGRTTFAESPRLTDDLSQYTAKILSHKIINLDKQASFVREEDVTFYYSPISDK